MATVLAAVRKHGEEQLQVKRPGPRQNLDIPDGVELLMATGMRISELLALRWEDVYIDKPDKGSYWVQINGKVGWEKGRPMLRHDYRKTDDKILDLRISLDVAAMLRARRANERRPNPNGAIFPARGGSWMQLNNFRRRWRIVREQLDITYDLPKEEEETSGRKQERRESCDIDTATPHTFRRSVGTFIGETVSIDQAAQQLGHKRTAVTIRSYLRERQEAPDSSGHLASVMYKRDHSAASLAHPSSYATDEPAVQEQSAAQNYIDPEAASPFAAPPASADRLESPRSGRHATERGLT